MQEEFPSLADYRANPALYNNNTGDPFQAYRIKRINDKKKRVSKIRTALKELLEDSDPIPRYNVINALRSRGLDDISFSPRFTDRTPVYTPALQQARRDLRIRWTAFSPDDAAILTPGITQRPPDTGPNAIYYHYWYIRPHREIRRQISDARRMQ